MAFMPAAQRKLLDDEPPPSDMARLGDLAHGQEADFFALLSSKEELKTKDGKPYFRVAFRDAKREVLQSLSLALDACAR